MLEGPQGRRAMSWRAKQVAVVNMSTVVVLLSLIVAGCSNSTSDEPVSTVDDVSLDVTAADTSPVDVAPSIDSAGGDAAADAQDAQDTQDAPVCPGGAGCPCAQNVDCDGGLCLEGADGPRCARACVDSCEEGFACAQVPQGSDVVTVCVASWARLCVPCVQNADCVHPGVKGARCVYRGGSGRFCGVGCGDDGDCPKGYACKNAKDVEGDSATQCVPVDATGQLTECLCNANALTLAVKTPCSGAVIEGGVELVCPGWARCT